MASKFADRLCVLEDGAEALQSRLHFMKENLGSLEHRPKVLTNQALEKVRKVLEKKFPNGELKKEKGLDEFSRESHSIMEELKQGYSTMVGVLRFKQNALSLLNQAAMILGEVPDFASVSQIVWGILRLLTKYVQVQVQLAAIKEKKLIAALYFNAIKTQLSATGNQMKLNEEHQRFQELGSYLVTLDDNATRLVHDEFLSNKSITATVRSALLCIAPSYLAASNNRHIATKGVFSLNGLDHSSLALPPDMRTVFPYLTSEEAQTWVCYGIVACPLAICSGEEEGDEILLNLVKAVLSSTLVAPVYRDASILIHDQFQCIFNAFQGKNVAAPQGINTASVAKVKRALTEASLEAVNNLADSRAKARQQLALILENLWLAVTDMPGILGPKTSLILAALSLSRKEIISFFRHYPGQLTLPRLQAGVLGSITGGNTRFDLAKFKDSRIGRLIEVHLKLVSAVLKYDYVVKAYNTQALYETDPAILGALRFQLGNLAGPSNKLMDECHALFDEIEQLLARRSSSAEIAKLCKRAEVVLLSNETLSVQQGESLENYSELLAWRSSALECVADIALHVSLMDNLYGTMSRYAALGSVAFFHTASDNAFQDLLADPSHAGSSISLVHVLRDASLALHRLNPQEALSMQQQTVKEVSNRLNKVVAKLEKLMTKHLNERNDILLTPLMPIVAAKVLKRKYAKRAMESSNGGMGLQESQEIKLAARFTNSLSGVDQQQENKPGHHNLVRTYSSKSSSEDSVAHKSGSFKLKYCNPGIESKYENAASIKRLTHSREALVEMAVAIGRCDVVAGTNSGQIVVSNHVFSLQALVQKMITEWLKLQLKKSFVHDRSSNNMIARPSEVLRRIESASNVAQLVAKHVGIDYSHIHRSVWFEQTGGASQTRLGTLDETPADALKRAASAHIGAYSSSPTSSPAITGSPEKTLNINNLSTGAERKPTCTISDTLGGWFAHFVENLLAPGIDGAAIVHSTGNSPNASFSGGSHSLGLSGSNSLAGPHSVKNVAGQTKKAIHQHILQSTAAQLQRVQASESGSCVDGEKSKNSSSSNNKNCPKAGIDAQSATCPMKDGVQVKVIPGRSTSSSSWALHGPFGQPGIVYSEHCGGFIRVSDLQLKGKVASRTRLPLLTDASVFPAEQWLSDKELRDTATLIGPRGVRVVERNLVAIVATQVRRILTILRENQTKLQAFRAAEKAGDTTLVLQTAQDLPRTTVVAACLITAGNALLTRQALKKALAKCIELTSPELASTVRGVFGRFGGMSDVKQVHTIVRGSLPHEYLEAFTDQLWRDGKSCKMKSQGDTQKIDALANALGLDSEVTVDHVLQSVMAQTVLEDGSTELLELLPFAVSASMVHDAWKSSDILPHVNAHANNVHVIPFAMRHLLSAAFPVCFQIQNKDNSPTSWVQNLKSSMLDHINSAFRVVNTMKQSEATTFRDWPLNGMLVYLDVILKSCGGLVTYQDVQDVASIVQSANVNRSLGKVHGGDAILTPEQLERQTAQDANLLSTQASLSEFIDGGSFRDMPSTTTVHRIGILPPPVL